MTNKSFSLLAMHPGGFVWPRNGLGNASDSRRDKAVPLLHADLLFNLDKFVKGILRGEAF